MLNTTDRITAGAIAQQSERTPDKREVVGAIPASSTIFSISPERGSIRREFDSHYWHYL